MNTVELLTARLIERESEIEKLKATIIEQNVVIAAATLFRKEDTDRIVELERKLKSAYRNDSLEWALNSGNGTYKP